MTEASLIATLITSPSDSGAELAALHDSLEWLEVRADLLGDINPEWLRKHFKGRLLYSLRSRAEGGVCSDSRESRQRRLAEAARFYDRVELETGDLSESLLAEIPSDRRLVSWHGPACGLSEMKSRFAQLSSVAAGLYKMVARAARIGDEFAPLSLLKALGRTDTIAYAEGPLGFWSRLAALHLGAPAIYGLAPGGPVVPAEPTVNKLIDDYGLPALKPAREIFAIVGDPVFHSLSPRLHNAAYRALNHPALFVPFRVESFAEFWHEVAQSRAFDSIGLPVKGMTVASPHKEEALLTAQTASRMTRSAESANILFNGDGRWRADTTDPEAIYMAGRERGVVTKDKRAAVVGCGGAGRAIAAALVKSGARVTLVNRSAERGLYAARLFDLSYVPLKDFDAGGFDIVVNATPVGRDSDDAAFDVERLNDNATVIDLVYGARPTPLVSAALAGRGVVIDGRDVLVSQVLRQFRLMTGMEMPPGLAPETLGRRAPATGVVTPARPAAEQSAPALT